MTPLRWLAAAAAVLCVLFLPSLAHAETLEAPFGGKPISLGHGRVACDKPTGGWSAVGTGLSVQPPDSDQAVGQAVDLRVASERATCGTASETVTLVTLGEAPSLDPTSITLDVDAGTLEMRGRGLRDLGVSWRARSASGADVCRDPKPAGTQKRCVWSLAHDLPADPSELELSYIPAGGRRGPEITAFDSDGKPIDATQFTLIPAQVLVSRLIPADAAVDLSTGLGEVPLAHPEAVASVECTGAACSLAGGKLVVRGQTSFVSSVEVKLTLVHGVLFKHDDHLDPKATLRLSVLHCPMSFAAGPPLRGVDSTLTVMKFEGRCAGDVGALHFLEGSRPLDVVRTESETSTAWVLLRLGRLSDNDVSITAVRGGSAEIPVAVAHSPTRPPPDVRTVLEIPGLPRLAFIPSNRGAVVHVPPPGDGVNLVLLPIQGVYTTEMRARSTLVVGDAFASGVTSLRFGYRSTRVPPAFADVDLAVLEDPLGRPIHEVNIPAPLAGTLAHPEPLAEVTCSDGHGKNVRLEPGETEHLPYSVRDGCRLIVHRERLLPEYGTQKLSLDIDVLRADGTARSDAHASQTLILRAGNEPLEAWIHGVQAPFDHVVVRLSHIADETHYTAADEMLTSEPALKWSVIIGSGHARLYAAPTIPTGLYRFGDAHHSGLLSLNFGVISRLTWLDDEGHEGFLNLEFGVMVIGLAGSESTTGQSLSQAGAVAGLGIGIPFANRSSITEAAINLHLWLERDLATPATNDRGTPWSIIFGPSISIGNVGANL